MKGVGRRMSNLFNRRGSGKGGPPAMDAAMLADVLKTNHSAPIGDHGKAETWRSILDLYGDASMFAACTQVRGRRVVGRRSLRLALLQTPLTTDAGRVSSSCLGMWGKCVVRRAGILLSRQLIPSPRLCRVPFVDRGTQYDSLLPHIFPPPPIICHVPFPTF